jgi:membrane protein
MILKNSVALVRKTYQEWNDDKAPRLGAALAYYTVFSIAPLAMIAIAIVGAVYGEDAAQGLVAKELRNTVGPAGAEVVQDIIKHASHPGTGILATVIGFGTLLFGAAGGFWQLQDALNTVWKVAPKPGRGLLGTVRDRLFSFLLVVAVGFFLLASLAVTTALAAVSQTVQLPELPGGFSVWQLVNGVVSFLSITLLFAVVYKVLPDVRIPWGDVWTGAALTALLFTIGKHLLGLYLGYVGMASEYGAAGSLVVLIFWVYYSAQVFLFGAEFTRVHAEQHASWILPADNAVLLKCEDLVRQGILRSGDIAAAARAAERNR